jgi:uncharacterized membrane protein
MDESRTELTDKQVEQRLGRLLQVGVVAAATVVFIGGVLYLARHGAAPADHKEFHGEPADLRSPVGIVQSALALQSRGIIQLGLLLLVATPVVRVGFSVVAFARQRDYIFVALTMFVLVVLACSLVVV